MKKMMNNKNLKGKINKKLIIIIINKTLTKKNNNLSTILIIIIIKVAVILTLKFFNFLQFKTIIVLLTKIF